MLRYSLSGRFGDRPLWLAQRVHRPVGHGFASPRSSSPGRFIARICKRMSTSRDRRVRRAARFLVQHLCLSTLPLEQSGHLGVGPDAPTGRRCRRRSPLSTHRASNSATVQSYAAWSTSPPSLLAPRACGHLGSHRRYDAVISTNTLDTYPRGTIAEIWREAFRLLRPGGIVSSKIGYSVHYAHTDPSISLLNYLAFDDAACRRHNHANHYQNRLRHCHHVDLLTQAGFVVEESRAEGEQDPTGLAIRQLVAGDPTDYCVDGSCWVGRPGTRLETACRSGAASGRARASRRPLPPATLIEVCPSGPLRLKEMMSELPTNEFIPPAKPLIGDEERAAVDRVMARHAGPRPRGRCLREEFSRPLLDGRPCVAVNSGTSGSHLGLLAPARDGATRSSSRPSPSPPPPTPWP